MALNSYIGWGISTLALYFLNKGSKSGSDTSSPEPSDLNVTETKIGAPIPVVMGTTLLKSPLTTYYGGFESKIYTESYAAHANFNAWPLVFSLIAQVLSAPATGTTENKGKVTSGKESGSSVASKGTTKDKLITPLINTLFMWLLNWLINGRNLKTTIQKGFKYYLGYQQILCWSSPKVKLKKIYMNEKLVWEGDAGRETQNGAAFVIPVNDEQLFGGPDEGGGFIGEIHVYFGGECQMPDAWMEQEMRSETIPRELQGLTSAYRPFVSVVVPKSYVGKSATVPKMWYEIENIPVALGVGAVGSDANAAEILYEMHVNRDWGLAESADLLNRDALIKLGEKLSKDKIGLTVPLASKTTAGQAIESILEHINAVKYIEPQDGRLTYRLVRGDLDEYKTGTKPPEEEKDLKDMLLLNESNIKRISCSRLDWRETVSEISVTYTDRAALYETGSISDSDAANVDINGGVVTAKSYSLPYFTGAENALWAAKRELMQQGYPLAAVSIEGNRTLYAQRIGDLCCLNFPAYGIKNMLLRVTDVNLGDFTDGTVKLELLEDIFGLAKTDFGFSNSTEWQPAPLYPTGAQNFMYWEFPYEIMRIKDTYVHAFVVRPDDKTETWTIWRKRGGMNFETTNTMSKWTAAGRLVYDYDAYGVAEDLIGIEILDLGGLEDLRFTAIGTNDAADIVSARRGGKVMMMGDEVMAWSSLTQLPNGHWRVAGIIRGVFDTVPQTHGNGEIIYFFASGHSGNVTTGGPVCLEGETADEFYNVTTGTVREEEDFDDAKIRKLTTVRRAERPSPPGKIRMTDFLAFDQTHLPKAAHDLKVTWVARDKATSLGCVSQDDEQDYWTREAFTAPVGLRYIVNVYADGARIKSETLPTEAVSFTYTWADRAKDGGTLANLQGETSIEIYAKLNELLSYQAQKRTFSWTVPTMANAMADEPTAAAWIAAQGDSVEITVPVNKASAAQYIKYTDLPVVLLGEKVLASAANTILCYDGDYIVPDGRALLVKDRASYELVALDPGYVIRSKYHEPGTSAADQYYQWNGTQFVSFS